MLRAVPKGVVGAPSFISSSINRASTATSVTVTAPASIQNGDLLVCFFYAAAQNATTLPTGFTSAYTDTASNPRINVGYKIASSESGNYTFSPASSANLSAAILVYRTASFNVVGTLGRSVSPTVSAPSVTSTLPGILIASFTTNNTTAPVPSAPSGMTQREASIGSVNAPSVIIFDEVISVSGATGTRTVTWAAGTATSGIQFFVA
jgi:hypothetical protein